MSTSVLLRSRQLAIALLAILGIAPHLALWLLTGLSPRITELPLYRLLDLASG